MHSNAALQAEFTSINYLHNPDLEFFAEERKAQRVAKSPALHGLSLV